MATRFEGDPSDFDPEFADALTGSTLLVGVSYRTATGELIEQRQYHGVVKQCTLEEGLTLTLTDGSELDLPPATRWIEPASPGEYRLRSTGEVVVDPDYIVTVTLGAPPIQ